MYGVYTLIKWNLVFISATDYVTDYELAVMKSSNATTNCY